MKFEFSDRCMSGPHREGSYGYYNRPAGTCYSVDYDSKRWFYRVAPGERREFRNWIAFTFRPNDGHVKLSGRYPTLYVDRVPT